MKRKRGHMRDAQQHWSFLTNYDASTVKTEPQLVSMVNDRTGVSRAEATADVQAWVAGRQF